jgi:hypothetical protein
MLLGRLVGPPVRALAVDADELAQVLDPELGEGRRVLVAEAVDGQPTVLRLQLGADC